MRYILIILVFLSVGVNAQMVIKAHANYRPYAQPAANLLLDDYPNAAAAYSLRKLDKDYTGAAIRVRKDTTGQPEQDIGFTASGDLDTASLKSFLNARSGFVTTWYDQSGNGRNATQATQANQPRIALNGVFDRDAITNRPYLYLDGGDFLGRTDTGFPTADATYITLSYLDKANLSADEYRCIFNYGNAALNQGVFNLYGEDGNIGNEALGFSQYGNALGISNRQLVRNLFFGTKPSTTGNWNIWINNSLTATKSMTTATTLNNGANSFTIGSFNNPTGLGGYLIGYATEIIIYGSNQSSNRTGIQNNINSYYSIY